MKHNIHKDYKAMDVNFHFLNELKYFIKSTQHLLPVSFIIIIFSKPHFRYGILCEWTYRQHDDQKEIINATLFFKI